MGPDDNFSTIRLCQMLAVLVAMQPSTRSMQLPATTSFIIKHVTWHTCSASASLALSSDSHLLCVPLQDQLMTCTSMYVEEQLLSQFGTLIGFVKRAEAAQKHKGGQAEGVPLPGYGPNEAAPVLQDFASKWQASIDALHK